jgi:hypothetical protein
MRKIQIFLVIDDSAPSTPDNNNKFDVLVEDDIIIYMLSELN